MKKINLYIIGAGGYGREISSYLKDFTDQEKNWNFKGFIDDNLNAFQNIETTEKVLGRIDDFKFSKDDYAIVAIGDINIKTQIVKRLKGKLNFYTFVAKQTYIGDNVKLGEGVLICPGVKLPANIIIGDFVSINIDSRVGHDSVIGNYCSIMPNVDIGGESRIGDSVFFGTKSTILPKTKIQSNNYIGVASVILKEIKTTNGTYFGSPARKMK